MRAAPRTAAAVVLGALACGRSPLDLSATGAAGAAGATGTAGTTGSAGDPSATTSPVGAGGASGPLPAEGWVDRTPAPLPASWPASGGPRSPSTAGWKRGRLVTRRGGG